MKQRAREARAQARDEHPCERDKLKGTRVAIRNDDDTLKRLAEPRCGGLCECVAIDL